MSLLVLSTYQPWPCPRCAAQVPARGRRIVEQPGAPLCDQCLAAADLTNADAVLAAVAAIEDRLKRAHQDGQPITSPELLDLLGPVADAAFTLAVQPP